MKKGFSGFLVAGISLGLGLLLASQARSGIKEQEPNNTPGMATLISLGTQRISGSSDLLGDIDYYQTEFVDGMQTRAVLAGLSGSFSARMTFLNAAGNPIVLDFERNPDGSFKLDSSGNKIPVFAEVFRGGGESNLTLNVRADAMFQPGSGFLPPGPGFIRILNDLVMPDKNMNFNYRLLLSRGTAEIEANDATAQAQAIVDGEAILGNYPLIGPASLACSVAPHSQCVSDGDCVSGTCVFFEGTTDDVYSFSVADPDLHATIVLDVPENMGVDMTVELSDAGGQVLASARRQVLGISKEVLSPVLALPLKGSGQFFVRVFAADLLPRLPGIVPLDYTLFLKLQSGPGEIEPNPSFAEAVPVQIGSGITLHGGLQSEGDVDVYRMVVPPGQVLVADLDSTSPINFLDGVVSAFVSEDDGKAFASNDNNSIRPAGASFSLVNRDGYLRVLPPRSGEVFVAVGDSQNNGGSLGFDYNLKFSTFTPGLLEVEPNDDSQTAGRLKDSSAVRGTIGRSDDVDFFVIDGLAGETMQVNINAFGIGSFLDARVILRDPVGTVLVDASDSDFSPDPFIIIPQLALSGDYSLEVRRRAGTSGFGASQFYEVTATTVPSVQTVVGNPDLDASGRIDGFDLALLSRHFGISSGDPLFDPNLDVFPDNSIDGQDLSVMGEFFGGIVPQGMGPGQTRILTDTEGDGSPFFGPTMNPPDLLGVGTSASAGDVNVTAFFADPVGSGVGGIMSIDTDASGLTGNLATADAFIGRRNLGSELEVFFDADDFQIFEVSDSRSDVLPAFNATAGGVVTQPFPRNVNMRQPLAPQLLSEGPTVLSGKAITFTLPGAMVGDLSAAQTAVLALSTAAVEPTDRLPNRGRIALGTPFTASAVAVSQMVCQTNAKVLCDPSTSDADCGAGVACVDADGASSPLPVQRVVLLRTPAHARTLLFPTAPPFPGLLFANLERGKPFSGIGATFEARILDSLVGADRVSNESNDKLENILPPGRRLRATDPSTLDAFKRDELTNFSPKLSSFDNHTDPGLPPPDVDLYYFIGSEGDRAVINVETVDQGATFDSKIDLFTLPTSLSVTNPSSPLSVQAVPESELELLSSTDDKSAMNLDPRMEFILPRSGVFVVKVTASPKAVLPGVSVAYSIELESLRPDEVSVPVIMRGPYSGVITGVKFQLQFDPSKVQVTGIDDAVGLRSLNSPGPFSAQEMVVQPVPGSPGHVDVAVRSFQGIGPVKPPSECPRSNPVCTDSVTATNGLSGSRTTETLVVRIRFRGVGPGSTRVRFVPNPSVAGESLINLAVRKPNKVLLPANGFGPGVTITVTP